MIDDTMAERMVACGWIGAVCAAAFMALLAFLTRFPVGLIYLGGAAILAALAYGIYRRSRACAVIALLNHVLGAARLVAHASYLPPLGVLATVALGVLYVLGVIGVFVHHARRGAAAV